MQKKRIHRNNSTEFLKPTLSLDIVLKWKGTSSCRNMKLFARLFTI